MATYRKIADQASDLLMKGQVSQARNLLERHVGPSAARQVIRTMKTAYPDLREPGGIRMLPEPRNDPTAVSPKMIDRRLDRPQLRIRDFFRPFRRKGEPVPTGPSPRKLSVQHYQGVLSCFMCGGPAVRNNSQLYDLILGDKETTARKCADCYYLKDGIRDPELIRRLATRDYPNLTTDQVRSVGFGVIRLAAACTDYWPTDEPREPWAHVSRIQRLKLDLELSELAKPPVPHRSDSGRGCRFCGVAEATHWHSRDTCRECDKEGFTWGERSMIRGRILRSALGIGTGRDGKRRGLVVSLLDEIGVVPFHESPLSRDRPGGTTRRWGYILDDQEGVDLLCAYSVMTWKRSCPRWMVETYSRPRETPPEPAVRQSGIRLQAAEDGDKPVTPSSHSVDADFYADLMRG